MDELISRILPSFTNPSIRIPGRTLLVLTRAPEQELYVGTATLRFEIASIASRFRKTGTRFRITITGPVGTRVACPNFAGPPMIISEDRPSITMLRKPDDMLCIDDTVILFQPGAGSRSVRLVINARSEVHILRDDAGCRRPQASANVEPFNPIRQVEPAAAAVTAAPAATTSRTPVVTYRRRRLPS